MFAATMHHTTSILLLQSKPPAAQSISSLKSRTWHAVQICGICLSNNASWSHDPTILAVLIYVGKFISYHEQRKELLGVLYPLLRDSGLRMNEAFDDMVELWKMDSGFHTK